MKNIIVITTDINENYNFASNVVDAKKHIMEYFGNKYATHDAQQPVVCVQTEISKADVEHLHNLINDTAVHLTVILTNENSDKRIDGDFIDIRE